MMTSPLTLVLSNEARQPLYMTWDVKQEAHPRQKGTEIDQKER